MTATITWFDGKTDAATAANGKIVMDSVNGGWAVLGSHKYDMDINTPREKFSVTIFDPWGGKDTKEQFSQNYAVLFSGGGNELNNWPRYIKNLREVYWNLTQVYHLNPQNIYVLYANGGYGAEVNYGGLGTKNNPNPPSVGPSDMYFLNPGTQLVSATSANLQSILDTLSHKITIGDHFLFYATDHGNGELDKPTITNDEVLVGWHESISDKTLADQLNNIHAGYNTYVFTECFAGGMIDELKNSNGTLNDNQFACAAANHYEYAYGGQGDFKTAFAHALSMGVYFTDTI
jgi:hypothetical protein